jgi:hypothetical protein
MAGRRDGCYPAPASLRLLRGIASEAQQSMFHADGWIASQCGAILLEPSLCAASAVARQSKVRRPALSLFPTTTQSFVCETL